MTLPTYPAVAAEFLATINGDAYDAESNPGGMAAGGHRQNFPLTMTDIAILAGYFSELGSFLDALAAQVTADAESAAEGSGTEATAAAIRSGADAFYMSVRRAYAAMVPVVLADGASIAWDMATGINFKATLGAAGRTLANPTNQVAGKSGFVNFYQDGTGGRTVTTWGNNFIWIGEQPDWPTTPGARTKVAYFVAASGEVELTFAGNSA